MDIRHFRVEPEGFLNELFESHLVPSRHHLQSFTLRDFADFTFLYCIVLYLLKEDFTLAPVAARYAEHTHPSSGFNRFYLGATDLRIMVTGLLGEETITDNLTDRLANDRLLSRLNLDESQMRRFLHNISQYGPNTQWDKQFLFKLERDLNIENSNYRSVRRLAIEWDKLSTSDKKLVVTRLLQAFRARIRRSELLPYLEQLAGDNSLEMKDVNNPETGEMRDGGMSFLKGLAGFAAGYAAVKKLLK